jgi:predicted N-acetyltransferase YhbS
MMWRMADFQIHHLHQRPALREAVARLIHHEFWTTVPGASVERMAQRLLQADRADAVPLCLVAVQGEQLLGVVNLVDNDDDDHPEWRPWLAGMVVAEAWRGQGVGSALVRALCAQAWAQGFERVYFGTDGPGFYLRLGAVHHQQPRPGFWFMRFDRPTAVSPPA